jgi:GYF domain 2
MSNHDEMATEETEDRFYAQFDSREVELMTLDGLQAAFEAGRIHENTFVCREGDDQWLTLAEVAGLGDEPEPEPVVVAERRPPMPQRRVEGVETRPPMPARRVEGVETRPPMPERRPVMNTEPAQHRFQNTVAPVVTSNPLSYAPVSSNIDYDLYDLALRPKRRWGRVLFAAAALTLIGGGAAFALGGGARSLGLSVPSMAALESAGNKTQASLTLDNIPTKPSEPAAAPVAPAPEPVAAVAAAPTPAASDAPAAAPNLSDDMKQALLAQDKVHQTKHAAKVKARAASAETSVSHHGKAASVGGGFKSGGSAYDPLNGKL